MYGGPNWALGEDRGPTVALSECSVSSAIWLLHARRVLPRPGWMVSPPHVSPHETVTLCGPCADLASPWTLSLGCLVGRGRMTLPQAPPAPIGPDSASSAIPLWDIHRFLAEDLAGANEVTVSAQIGIWARGDHAAQDLDLHQPSGQRIAARHPG